MTFFSSHTLPLVFLFPLKVAIFFTRDEFCLLWNPWDQKTFTHATDRWLLIIGVRIKSEHRTNQKLFREPLAAAWDVWSINVDEVKLGKTWKLVVCQQIRYYNYGCLTRATVLEKYWCSSSFPNLWKTGVFETKSIWDYSPSKVNISLGESEVVIIPAQCSHQV